MNIDVLLGKTLKNVYSSQDEVTFEDSDGKSYKMYHSQDCCESVVIESIVGDLKDLIGLPILQADESSSRIPEEAEGSLEYMEQYSDESSTWTFYRLATNKGHVVIRWHGASNGYYSESVDFEEVT